MVETPHKALPHDPEVLRDRVDLAPIIAAMLAGTYKPTIPDAEFEREYVRPRSARVGGRKITLRDENAISLFRAIKSEKNAIVSILSDAVWNDPEFVQRRNAMLMTTPDDRMPLLVGRLYDEYAQRVYERIVNNHPSHPLYPLTRRYERIIHFINEYIYGESPVLHLHRGIGTANQVAWGLVGVLGSVARGKGMQLSKVEAEAILRRAMRNIGIVLASMNQEVSIDVIAGMSTEVPKEVSPTYKIFDPRFFDIIARRGVKTLVVIPKALESLSADGTNPLLSKDIYSKTTMCPARYPVGDHEDVISEYLEWVVRLAMRHDSYLRNLSQ